MRDLHGTLGRIDIGVKDLRQESEAARRLIRSSGLPRKMAEIDAGRYGFTQIGLDLLDILEKVLALASQVAKQLTALLTEPQGKGFHRPRSLEEDEVRFANLFASFVACLQGAEETARHLEGRVRVENTFDLIEVRALLSASSRDLPSELLRDIAGYIDFQRGRSDPASRVDSASSLANCLHAYFLLMGNTIRELASDVAFRHLQAALEETPTEVLGKDYRGFSQVRGESGSPTGLLSVKLEDIVGNEKYLQACKRTARDVAGFDFEAKRNPKTFNPILFALGRPGCGKTVSAHAVGKYFLQYCKERNVPARFLQIRRTDWASSYQNASANTLVQIFTREVGAFPGVVGVYWPDIDTAFAAREDPGIRAEEKNILGACFGIFDGTLLPKNDKWFMMCDANHMTMDEATVSRITQDPHLLKGAHTVEERIRLLRDIKLRDHAPFLKLSAEEWQSIGARLTELDLSGRSIDNIARRVVTEIEDFEYPDEYFRADFEWRRAIIAEQSNTLDSTRLQEMIERHAAFERESEARAEKERFDRRVSEIVFNLSAQQEAMSRYGAYRRENP